MKKVIAIVQYTVTALVTIAAFVFIYYYVNPVLIDFKQQPLFLHGKFYSNLFLAYPGGYAEYLSLFISQYFTNKFAGASLLTLLSVVVGSLCYLLLKKRLSKQISWGLSFIPSILLISLHSYYQFTAETDLIIIVALLLYLLNRILERQNILIRLTVAIAFAFASFNYFGSSALFLFLLILLIEGLLLSAKKDYIVSGIIVFAAISFIFYTSATSAYLDLKKTMIGILEIKDKNILYLQVSTLLLIPLFLCLSPLINKFSEKKKLLPQSQTVVGLSSFIFLLVIAIVSYTLAFNQFRKDNVLIHYYAKNERWSDVLKCGQNLPLNDRKVVYQLNRALYHQGSLTEQAFAIPQFWGENGLILTPHYNSEVLMHCSDLFYDMGHIKGALHWAYEAQTKFPYSPDVLKRIAVCNLILGEYPTAEKFITLLSKSTIHRKWALEQSKLLNNEQAIEAIPAYAQKRRLIPHEDFYSNTQQPQYDLSMLLKQHPENKMAFEYFMFDALLTHDLAKVANYLPYLKKLGYSRIPVHIEEGLLLFKALNKDHTLDLGGYTISNESRERFIAYSKIMAKYRQNLKEGQVELRKDFGKTFWYYIQFVSPITTKREFIEK